MLYSNVIVRSELALDVDNFYYYYFKDENENSSDEEDKNR